VLDSLVYHILRDLLLGKCPKFQSCKNQPLEAQCFFSVLDGLQSWKGSSSNQDKLMLLPILLGVFITGRPVPGKELTDEFNALEAGLWKTISLTKGDTMQQIWYSQLVSCFFAGSIFFPL
jgi:hypothetical protein